MNGVLKELGVAGVLRPILDLPSAAKDCAWEVHGDDLADRGHTKNDWRGVDLSREGLRGKHTAVGGEIQGCHESLGLGFRA